MRALTLWPEWAHAVAHLGKRVENRPWPIPEALVDERIAIHAGKSIGGRPGVPATVAGLEAVEVACFEANYRGCDWDLDPPRLRRYQEPWLPIITSAIVCTAVLRGSTTPGVWLDGMAWGNPASPWWWHLADVRVLVEPVPCGGRLGLWRLPEDIAAAIERAEWRKT